VSDALLELLLGTADGRFPPPDGAVELVPAPAGRSDAVLGFTASNVVATPLPAGDVLAQLEPGDLGAPMSPAFLLWLARRLGSVPGALDVVLVADPLRGTAQLEERDDLEDHPRVARARLHREDVHVFARDDGIVTLGRGLARRLEVSVEVQPGARGAGLGRSLALAARCLVDEPLFAQVSPGNSASVRAFLAAGYRPIGSEVLFLRDRAAPDMPGV
jgi:hypothetical protein